MLCPISKKLVDCNSGEIFLVTGSLGGLQIGAVVSVFINNISYCVTYTDNVTQAPTHTLTSVESGDLLYCALCTPGTSPTPTPSITPTNTPTPTTTPTPSTISYTYVYRMCVGGGLSPILVAQNVPVPGITTVGQGFVSSLTAVTPSRKCTFVDMILGWNPSYPANVIYTGNYFGTPTTISPTGLC
jgi:hypothetical protein